MGLSYRNNLAVEQGVSIPHYISLLLYSNYVIHSPLFWTIYRVSLILTMKNFTVQAEIQYLRITFVEFHTSKYFCRYFTSSYRFSSCTHRFVNKNQNKRRGYILIQTHETSWKYIWEYMNNISTPPLSSIFTKVLISFPHFLSNPLVPCESKD